MFFSVEATNARGWRWISGFVSNREAAESFFLSVPEEARAMHGIVEVPLNAYPTFIIENKHQDFAYGDLDFIRARRKGLVPAGDGEYIHMNVYAISEDFSPRRPGIDRMGSLLH